MLRTVRVPVEVAQPELCTAALEDDQVRPDLQVPDAKGDSFRIHAEFMGPCYSQLLSTTLTLFSHYSHPGLLLLLQIAHITPVNNLDYSGLL